MAEITDEMVERAREAYRKAIVSPDHPTATDIMRSIIHAIAPMIAAQERERCAALAEAFPARIHGALATAAYAAAEQAADEIAAAIRQEPGHE
jgi:hypothetical protein